MRYFQIILFFLGLDGFDVRKIDDIEYTVEISCYFLTKWKDDRLILKEDIQALIEPNNGSKVEETWFPIDLEFVSKVSIKLTTSYKDRMMIDDGLHHIGSFE